MKGHKTQYLATLLFLSFSSFSLGTQHQQAARFVAVWPQATKETAAGSSVVGGSAEASSRAAAA